MQASEENEEQTVRVTSASKRKSKTPAPAEAAGTVSGARLKSFIERIEKLAEEQKACGEDTKEIYQESKGAGFEPKIIRKLVGLRKQNTEKRKEENDLLELYAAAIQYPLF